MEQEANFPAEFETLWSLYPKKQGKEAAFEAYAKARTAGTTVEKIKSGVESYAEYCRVCQTEEKFIKAGGNWFSQHCWDNVYKSTPPTSGSKDIPKGASGTLGAAEKEALQQTLGDEDLRRWAAENPL